MSDHTDLENRPAANGSLIRTSAGEATALDNVSHMDATRQRTASPESDYEHPEGRWLLGTGLLYGGVIMFALAILDRIGSLPFPMPDMWYANRPFMPFIAILCVMAGVRLVRVERDLHWKPTRSGRRFSTVVLYTRNGCHLCDEALDMLRRYSRWLAAPVEVDIDGDPELKEAFHTCVPVVQFDGKVRFKGRVNEVLLRRLIEGTAPLDLAATSVSSCSSGACGSGSCGSGACGSGSCSSGSCEDGACDTSGSCGKGKCGSGKGCGSKGGKKKKCKSGNCCSS